MDDLFSTLLAIGAIYGVYRWFFSSNLSSRPSSSHNTSHSGCLSLVNDLGYLFNDNKLYS